MSDIEILATGHLFVKRNRIRATQPVIERLLHNVESSIHMLAYKFGPGIEMWDLLESKIKYGYDVTIIVSLDDQIRPVKKHLQEMAHQYPNNFHLMDFDNPEGGLLHAKVLVVDRKTAVLGSANFSKGGLTNHYEIGLLIENEDIAWNLASLVDDLKDSDLANRIL